MAAPTPIPPDLWLRLYRLDATHDCRFERTDARGGRDENGQLTSGLNFDRWWTVRIWPRGCPERAVISQHERLARALEGAVRMAEGMVTSGDSLDWRNG